jgi:hypothetical protein
MADQFHNAPPSQPGWQAHHRIHQQAFKTNAFLQELGRRGLFSPTDFVTNGIMLPDDPAVTTAKGLSTHLGYHGRYNRFINDLLDLAGSSSDPKKIVDVRALPDEDARLLAGRVRTIQAYAEMAVSGVLPEGHIPLNRADPIVPDALAPSKTMGVEAERAWVADFYDRLVAGARQRGIDQLVDWSEYELLKRAQAFDPDISAAERVRRVAQANAIHRILTSGGQQEGLERLAAAGRMRMGLPPPAGSITDATALSTPEQRHAPPRAAAETAPLCAEREAPAVRGEPPVEAAARPVEPAGGRPASGTPEPASAPVQSPRPGLGARISEAMSDPSQGRWTAPQRRRYGRLSKWLGRAGLVGLGLDLKETGSEVIEDLRHDRPDAAKEKVKDFALRNAGGAIGYAGGSLLAASLGAGPVTAIAAGLAAGYYLGKAKGNPAEAFRMMQEDAVAAGQWVKSKIDQIRRADPPGRAIQVGPQGNAVHMGPPKAAVSPAGAAPFPSGRNPAAEIAALRAYARSLGAANGRQPGSPAAASGAAPLHSAEQRRDLLDRALFDHIGIY